MRFISIVLVALSLGASMAHLLALPNKIDLPPEDYFTTQQLYRGWSLLGVAVIGALLSVLVLTIMVRGQGKVFILTLIALRCGNAGDLLGVTFPANQQTRNWRVIPDNWENLKSQWEYSHAGGAVPNLAAFCLLVLSLLAQKK